MKNNLLFLVVFIISCSQKPNETKTISFNKKEKIIQNLKKYKNSESVIDIVKITYQTIDSIEVRVDTMKKLSLESKKNYNKILDATVKDIETACNNVFLNLSDYERIKVLKTTEKTVSDQKGMLEYLYRKLKRENIKGWKQQKEK
jgi:hypothetical protein